jgi:hypothetical protein
MERPTTRAAWLIQAIAVRQRKPLISRPRDQITDSHVIFLVHRAWFKDCGADGFIPRAAFLDEVAQAAFCSI